MLLLAGHGRLEVAAQMWAEGELIRHYPVPYQVPTVDLSHLSADERRANILAKILVDNKLAENAGWDPDLLAAELGGLREVGFDLSVIRFDDGELSELLDPPGRPVLVAARWPSSSWSCRSARSMRTTRRVPVLCELAYRWFCLAGGLVLDPFAGGSVRGIFGIGRLSVRSWQCAGRRNLSLGTCSCC